MDDKCDYRVQCFCGWEGRISQLLFTHCPECSAEFNQVPGLPRPAAYQGLGMQRLAVQKAPQAKPPCTHFPIRPAPEVKP